MKLVLSSYVLLCSSCAVRNTTWVSFFRRPLVFFSYAALVFVNPVLEDSFGHSLF